MESGEKLIASWGRCFFPLETQKVRVKMKMEKESESIREHVSFHDGEWHTANRKLWVFFLKK